MDVEFSICAKKERKKKTLVPDIQTQPWTKVD